MSPPGDGAEPGLGSLDQRAMAERAQQLLDLRRPREAAALLSHALASAPGDPELLCAMAQASLALDDPAAARDVARQAVAARPDDSRALRLLALAASQMGRDDEAVRTAERAVGSAPLDSWAHIVLAMVCTTPQTYARGVEAARRAVALSPLEPGAHVAVGQMAVRTGDAAAGAAAFRAALALDPANQQARSGLGLAAMTSRNPTAAAGHFAAVLAAAPREESAALNLDAVVINAIGRTAGRAWICFFVASLVLRAEGPDARARGIAVDFFLAVAFAVAAERVHSRLTSATDQRLVTYLRTLPRRDRLLTATVASLAIAGVSLFVAGLLTSAARSVALGVAGVGWITAWVLLRLRIRRHDRASHGAHQIASSDADPRCADFVFRWLLFGVILFGLAAALTATPIDATSVRVACGVAAAGAGLILLLIVATSQRRLEDGLPAYLFGLVRRRPGLGAAVLLAGIGYALLVTEGVIGAAGSDLSGAVRTPFAWAAAIAYYAALGSVSLWRVRYRSSRS